MNRMYLQILYSEKKKEGKIVDLSLLTEDEKIALLELYKVAYEKLQLEEAKKENEAAAILKAEAENEKVSVEDEINKIDSEKLSADEETSQADSEETKETVTTENQSEESKTEETITTENQSKESKTEDIEITYEDEPTYMDDIMGNVVSSGVSNYGAVAYDEKVVENGEKSNRSDSFEYTSFTPYKPKYEDIELTNDFFDMNTNMGMQVEVSKSTGSEKYNLKTKNKRSNTKVSKNGAYTIADSYSATKEKIEVPYLKIATILFSVLALGCIVTQFLYNYEQVKFMNYLCDFCFGITVLCIFVSTITASNVVNSFKGIGLFLSFSMHFVCFGIVGYQDGLFRILNQEGKYDLIYGVASIGYLLFLYIFMLAVAVHSMISKKASAKAINIIAVILVIVTAVMLRCSQLTGNITVFYNVLPEYVAIILFVIATALSCNIKRNNR